MIDLTAQPHITPDVLRLDHAGVPIAVPFAGSAFVLLLVAFVVWSARARSLSADTEVDRVFRTRTARVVLGLGIAVQLVLLQLSWWRMEFLARNGAGAAFDPAAVAIGDWAQTMNDFVQPGMLVIFAAATFSWICIVAPWHPPKKPQLSPKKA